MPLGVPHRLIEEDNYRGYIVPEGTTILANAWYAWRTLFTLKIREFTTLDSVL